MTGIGGRFRGLTQENASRMRAWPINVRVRAARARRPCVGLPGAGLLGAGLPVAERPGARAHRRHALPALAPEDSSALWAGRSEEHTSELQSPIDISYA